jgi:hypothetical protein
VAVRGSNPGGGEIFRTHQTGPGVHPVSCTMGTGSSFPEVKRPGSEAHHSRPSGAEYQNEGTYTSTPPICLRGEYRDDFTLSAHFKGTDKYIRVDTSVFLPVNNPWLWWEFTTLRFVITLFKGSRLLTIRLSLKKIFVFKVKFPYLYIANNRAVVEVYFHQT